MPRRIDEDEEWQFLHTRDLMSKSARDRWNREQRARAEEVMADLENGRLSRMLMFQMRYNIGDLEEGKQLERFRRELLNALYSLRGEPMFNAAIDAHHAETTGTHSHDHAAFGARDSKDGLHFHPHTHTNDNKHDTAQHNEDHAPSAAKGKSSASTAEAQALADEGLYGREMRGGVGPAERHRLRAARLAEHERNR
jgi:hypothetical protein